MIQIDSDLQRRNNFNSDDLVCYCFKFTKNDTEKDFMKNNRSLIYEKIALEKKDGKCNCAEKNPKGR